MPKCILSGQKPKLTAADVGAVPTNRTVNGKALSANITLNASDVGAAATAICASCPSAMRGREYISTEKHVYRSNTLSGVPIY